MRGIGFRCWITVTFVTVEAFAATTGTSARSGGDVQRSGGGRTSEALVARLFAQYESGHFDAATSALVSVSDWPEVADVVRANLRDWPVMAGATFALEIASAAQDAYGQDGLGRDAPGNRILQAVCARFRTGQVPAGFEVDWYVAASALVQGIGSEWPLGVSDHGCIQQALRRFPSEPRLRLESALLKAVLIHRDFAMGRADGPSGPVHSQWLTIAMRELTALARDASLGPEARLHLGFLRMCVGELDGAVRELTELDGVAQTEWQRYVARLLLGRSLVKQGRLDGAEVMFRQALALVPGAQSAQLSLAGVLFLLGDRSEAAGMVVASLASEPVTDPWAWFAYGSHRHWPERIARLREYIQ